MNEYANETRVRVEDLSKGFKGLHALKNIDLSIEAGHVYGLVGPNGAGKSTLLRTMMGLLAPTSGNVFVLGTNSRDIGDRELDQIGYVDQNMRALGWGKVSHYVEEVARAYSKFDRARFEELQKRFGFPMEQRMSKVSPGTAQQIWTTLAFCHSPRLILLDEPGAGMDPIARATMLDLCYEAAVDHGAAVVLSSHILSDIERVCDRMLMMRGGRLIDASSLDDARERYTRLMVEGECPPVPSALREIPRMGGYEVIARAEQAQAWIAQHGAAHRYRELPLTFDEIYALEISPQAAA